MKRIGGMSPRHMARAIIEAVDDKERDDEEREDKDELSLAGPPDDIDKVVADEPKEDPPFAPDANMTIKDDGDEGDEVVAPEVDPEAEPKDVDERGGVEAKVLDFIVGQGGADDEALHRFAGELGMEPDDLEGVVYSILGSLAAGKARAAGLRKENVDPDELAKGIEVEVEHTDNRMVAEMIAMDHLAEIPDYYTRLETMENEARKAGSASDVPTGGDDGPPRPPTSWPNPSDGRRAPYHSMDPHDGAGEDDGW